MKLTKKEAKRLSLIKWNYARKTGKLVIIPWLEENHPKMKDLMFFCGYCEYYHQKCSRCPLFKKWGMSCDGNKDIDPFSRWKKAKTKKTRIKYAEIIYQDIKRS